MREGAVLIKVEKESMQLLLLSPLYEKDYILLPSGFLISRLDNFDCVREIALSRQILCSLKSRPVILNK